RDWDPHRVRVEPVLLKAKPGATLKAALVVTNPLPRREKLSVTLEGRGIVADQSWDVEPDGKDSLRKEFTLRLPDKMSSGRHVFAVRAAAGDVVDGSDAFLAEDVIP